MKGNGLTGRMLYWIFPGQYKQCRCCCLFCRWYIPCREEVEGPGQVHCKEKTLQDVRRDVYTLFLQAEKKYYESGQGEQKMKWVVSKARSLLPPWLQLVMTEDVFIKLIQIWFNGIKDLLDDGKINNNIKA